MLTMKCLVTKGEEYVKSIEVFKFIFGTSNKNYQKSQVLPNLLKLLRRVNKIKKLSHADV